MDLFFSNKASHICLCGAQEYLVRTNREEEASLLQLSRRRPELAFVVKPRWDGHIFIVFCFFFYFNPKAPPCTGVPPDLLKVQFSQNDHRNRKDFVLEPFVTPVEPSEF